MSIVITPTSDNFGTVLTNANIHFYKFSQNISYDTHLARIYFEAFEDGMDGMERQLLSGRNSRGYDYVICYGENIKATDPHFTKSKLRKTKKIDLIDLAYDYDLTHIDEEWHKDDIITELLHNIDHKTHYEMMRANNSWRNLDCDAIITGYHQGDAVKIVWLGKNAKKYNSEDYLHRLFFDAPIAGRIVVELNGKELKEYYADEMLADYYEWDKDEFMTNFKNRLAEDEKSAEYATLLLNWLEVNVPENPNIF